MDRYTSIMHLTIAVLPRIQIGAEIESWMKNINKNNLVQVYTSRER